MPHEERAFHAQTAEEVLEDQGVRPEQGLPEEEVARRREQYGANILRKAEQRGLWAILLDQFKSIVVILLGAAAVLAFAFAQWSEGIAILAVIVINSGIGFISEWRARRSMEALQKMARQQVRVRRQGKDRTVEAEDLVPGDIIIQESGDIVAADLRLIEANNLQVSEAALTGESVPVNKQLEPVEADVPLGERRNMLFKGTTVAEGSSEAVVVATGMQTEIGRISELVEQAEEKATPLEKRLDDLGRRLAWITIGIAIVVAGMGLLAGQPTLLMIETAIALGVAAIPEGLPIVATIALARGMWLMAQREALINQLNAVETLGATHIICTDKTGTLTENRMSLQRVATPAADYKLDDESRQDIGPLLRRAVEIGVLCTNASLDEDNEGQGDPTEVALLMGGKKLGMTHQQLLEEMPEVREVPFDSEVMMMATFHELEDGLEVAVKGAPSAVLEVCESIATEDNTERPLSKEDRQEWRERTENLASEGLRLLAVADKRVDGTDAEPYQGLRFVGLVGLLDPPREGVKKSIKACQSAGIRVIMITGDQPDTAKAIARQVGLITDEGLNVLHGRDLDAPEKLSEEDRQRILKTEVFARVNPEQKLHLVQIFQDHGDTVAMTGDGVNDTPALKKADIGIAMGKRGTDAARQIADMVLKDDAFSSIVAAVEQGRTIFSNIRKAVIFMLCTNVAEILAVALASVANAPLPLLPLQILYLNVLTDVFPALSLGVGKGGTQVMQKPPRAPDESVLTRSHWMLIGGWSFVISACVLTALTLALLWLDFEQTKAVTISFLTLGFSKLWFVFNLRDPGTTLLDNDVVRNPWIWMSLALCIVLLVLAVYLPGLSDLLQTEPLEVPAWSLVLGLSLIPMLIGQAIRFYQRHSAK
ncbi:MAG: cation-transporting P-type ATPase [Balneolales bacterium]